MKFIRTGISFNALMMRASKTTFCHSRSPTTQTITIFFSTVIVAYFRNTPTISSICLSSSNRYGNPDIGSGHHVHRRIVIIRTYQTRCSENEVSVSYGAYLILTYVMLSLAATALIVPFSTVLRDQCTRRIWLQCVQEAYRYVLFLGRQDASRM